MKVGYPYVWNDYMFVKLDIMNTYDKVEWNYLRWILPCMRFPKQWVEMVMHCVSSASFRVLLNGQPS